MSMKSKLGPLAALAIISGGLDFMSTNDNGKRNVSDFNGEPAKKPIPNGCKEYEYRCEFGVFKVIALNEKSAYKKYSKWYNNQYKLCQRTV